MANIQEKILEDFFKKLAELPDFNPLVIQELRSVFKPSMKPNAIDVVKALSTDLKQSQL